VDFAKFLSPDVQGKNLSKTKKADIAKELNRRALVTTGTANEETDYEKPRNQWTTYLLGAEFI
jgi:hypothetical protein